MVTQKLISLKVDTSSLDSLDNLCSLLGVNRNKFINHCISFVSEVVELQVDVAFRQNKSLDSIPFMSEFE